MAQADFSFLIGLYEAAAWELVQDNDRLPRITRRDGIRFVCTRDFNPNRINLEVEDNRVVAYTTG